MPTDSQTAEEWSVNGRTLQAACGRIEVFCGCDQERLLSPPVYQLTGTTGYLPPPLQRLIDAVLSDWNAGLSQ